MATHCGNTLEIRNLSSLHSLALEKIDYDRLTTLLKRKPTSVEWAMTKALWSEHCSYKSSKHHLSRLPSQGPEVICGPGENAGAIHIGDGLLCVLKMESHNHPSSLNPYHGAATGVGGILRDIFTMGAYPIALLDALFFGSPKHPKTATFLKEIVSGVSAYGNCFGIPTLAGLTYFHPTYTNNPLVNVMAIGLVHEKDLLTSRASGAGNPIFYIGNTTSYAGLHGAAHASRSFKDSEEPSECTHDTHTADPLMGRCVFRALQALQDAHMVIAAQDMGAAGLTCAAIEMAIRGSMGFVLNLDAVPQNANMNAESILLSETQERMLLILKQGAEEKASHILQQWEVPHASIGYLTSTGDGVIHHHGETVAHIPLRTFHAATPLYDRRSSPFLQHKIYEPNSFPAPYSNGEALKILLNTPNGGAKRWIYEQYDQTIQGNTLEPFSGNAALIRLPHSLKGLALTTDVTPRYCAADPFEGAKQAVAEAYRNITAVGAIPKAITNCLNFGSPENEDVMGQLVASIEGLREACLALELPIISGNVSLYNQTGPHPIFPTPTVGCVGLLENITKRVTPAFKKPGDAVFLIGHTRGWLGQSIYARDLLHHEVGAPPPVHLEEEKQHARFVRSLIAEGAATAISDCSHGGLLAALAKMALASFEEQEPCGIILHSEAWREEWRTLPKHAFFFGEDQGRYIVTTSPSLLHSVEIKAKKEGIPLLYLGATGGSHIVLPGEESLCLRELQTIYEIPLINRLS